MDIRILSLITEPLQPHEAGNNVNKRKETALFDSIIEMADTTAEQGVSPEISLQSDTQEFAQTLTSPEVPEADRDHISHQTNNSDTDDKNADLTVQDLHGTDTEPMVKNAGTEDLLWESYLHQETNEILTLAPQPPPAQLLSNPDAVFTAQEAYVARPEPEPMPAAPNDVRKSDHTDNNHIKLLQQSPQGITNFNSGRIKVDLPKKNLADLQEALPKSLTITRPIDINPEHPDNETPAPQVPVSLNQLPGSQLGLEDHHSKTDLTGVGTYMVQTVSEGTSEFSEIRQNEKTAVSVQFNGRQLDPYTQKDSAENHFFSSKNIPAFPVRPPLFNHEQQPKTIADMQDEDGGSAEISAEDVRSNSPQSYNDRKIDKILWPPHTNDEFGSSNQQAPGTESSYTSALNKSSSAAQNIIMAIDQDTVQSEKFNSDPGVVSKPLLLSDNILGNNNSETLKQMSGQPLHKAGAWHDFTASKSVSSGSVTAQLQQAPGPTQSRPLSGYEIDASDGLIAHKSADPTGTPSLPHQLSNHPLRGSDISPDVDIQAIQGTGPASIAPNQNQGPAAGPEPTRQVAIAIVQASSTTKETQVSLSPEELGKVHFVITRIDGHIVVTITAERPETLMLLQRNSELLSIDLAQAGMDDVSLAFGQSGHEKDQKKPFGQAEQPDKAGSQKEQSEFPARSRQEAVKSGRRLDLRI